VKSEEDKKQEILAAMSSMMGEEQAPEEGEEYEGEAEEGEPVEAGEERAAAVEGDHPHIPGVPDKVAGVLATLGLADREAIVKASDKDLLDIPGVGPKVLAHLREWAMTGSQEGEA
jgi:predicted flap endonuclease-1-like 5' DNA nuclease